MHEDHAHYQDAKMIFKWWKISIMKSLDGAGTVWVVIRLVDGKESERKFIDRTEEFAK